MIIAPSKRTADFRYAIRNVARAAVELERAGREVVYLNIGDPQAFGFRPPESVVEPVRQMLGGGFTGYASSAGLLEAREAVAAYASALGAPTEAQDVLMTAGASEAADLALTALVDEGDEVLLPAPGYPIYEAILNKLGAVPKFYKLDEKNNWQPSVEEIRALVNKRTRAFVLINPNNPTGSIIPDEIVSELLSVAAENNLPVISDEVYRDLCFGKPPPAASVFAEKMDVPLITLESLSKTHMLSGWRVGWMRFTHSKKMKELIGAIHLLASGRLCSPTPAQYAVRPALEGDNSFLKEFIAEIKRRRDFCLKRIAEIENLSCVVPEAAFYLMVKANDARGRPDEKFVLDLLEATGILLVHGSGFGTDPQDGYFRLVYLADEETLEKSFRKIDCFLNERC